MGDFDNIEDNDLAFETQRFSIETVEDQIYIELQQLDSQNTIFNQEYTLLRQRYQDILSLEEISLQDINLMIQSTESLQITADTLLIACTNLITSIPIKSKYPKILTIVNKYISDITKTKNQNSRFIIALKGYSLVVF